VTAKEKKSSFIPRLWATALCNIQAAGTNALIYHLTTKSKLLMWQNIDYSTWKEKDLQNATGSLKLQTNNKVTNYLILCSNP